MLDLQREGDRALDVSDVSAEDSCNVRSASSTALVFINGIPRIVIEGRCY